ncbi:MAG: HlyD family efflux transporter periplasmic adaptor subunit [Bacteroidetes bacterium]|nr:MAG: HlyD family efflux transporter periplasmic adaptor subunit [Bacteroidota bacterium]
MNSKHQLRSFDTIYRNDKISTIKYWFFGTLGFLLIVLFLPWTQNIKAKGTITSLQQEDRPQEINSQIPGRIVKWWVKEGDVVRKGDTILQLSEIKADYLDPNLINRTQRQLDAKKGTIVFYEGKVNQTASQIDALIQSKSLKIEQLKNKLKQYNNKLTGERSELTAATNEYNLAKDQYERQQKLFNEGLVSQTQLQQRSVAFQNALAKKQIVENKIEQTLQELANIKLDQQSTIQEYTEKISKAEGERLQSLSQIAITEGEVAKLENTVSNYSIRNGMYIVLAPQDGQIVQAKKAGVGEFVKEGEHITTIVPTQNSFAVEMYVEPIDLPLISIGQPVRFVFDGFPTIVFSGWPNASYGTFGGKIVAFENTISSNGLFRVLVAEDSTDRKWPIQLKMGSGAQGIALLKDVPIWYELWRNINGFPPDYYQLKQPKKPEDKQPKPTTNEDK